MIHRVTVRSNPRLLVLFLIIGVLPTVGVLALIYVDGLLRIVVPALAGYLTYQLVRLLASHLKSHVNSGEEGLRCRTTANEEIALEWNDITDCGVCVAPNGSLTLFVYDSEADQLLSIPQEYEGWQQLREEIRSRTDCPFQEIELHGSETVHDRLRILLGGGEQSTGAEGAGDQGEGPQPQQRTGDGQ